MTDLTPAALEGEILDDLAARLATFGRGRCNWLAVDTWATEARAPRLSDLCAGGADFYAVVKYSGGETGTHLCAAHTDRVRSAPGFQLARSLRHGNHIDGALGSAKTD